MTTISRIPPPNSPAWSFLNNYEDFPVKTIKKITKDDHTGMVGVYFPLVSPEDFINYTSWCRETFGNYGGAWEVNLDKFHIYFTHEKYYNWFMLKWG